MRGIALFALLGCSQRAAVDSVEVYGFEARFQHLDGPALEFTLNFEPGDGTRCIRLKHLDDATLGGRPATYEDNAESYRGDTLEKKCESWVTLRFADMGPTADDETLTLRIPGDDADFVVTFLDAPLATRTVDWDGALVPGEVATGTWSRPDDPPADEPGVRWYEATGHDTGAWAQQGDAVSRDGADVRAWVPADAQEPVRAELYDFWVPRVEGCADGVTCVVSVSEVPVAL